MRTLIAKRISCAPTVDWSALHSLNDHLKSWHFCFLACIHLNTNVTISDLKESHSMSICMSKSVQHCLTILKELSQAFRCMLSFQLLPHSIRTEVTRLTNCCYYLVRFCFHSSKNAYNDFGLSLVHDREYRPAIILSMAMLDALLDDNMNLRWQGRLCLQMHAYQ